MRDGLKKGVRYKHDMHLLTYYENSIFIIEASGAEYTWSYRWESHIANTIRLLMGHKTSSSQPSMLLQVMWLMGRMPARVPLHIDITMLDWQLTGIEMETWKMDPVLILVVMIVRVILPGGLWSLEMNMSSITSVSTIGTGCEVCVINPPLKRRPDARNSSL